MLEYILNEPSQKKNQRINSCVNTHVRTQIERKIVANRAIHTLYEKENYAIQGSWFSTLLWNN